MGDDTKFYDRVGLRESVVLQYCRFFFGLYLTMELESKAHALHVHTMITTRESAAESFVHKFNN